MSEESMKNKKRFTTKEITLAACMIAMTAICSQIQIPLTVPINLALLSVYLIGTLLGKRMGTITIVCYVLCGMVGLPVFAGFKGGFGVLFGKTGGYILGYIIAVIIVAYCCDRWGYGLKKLCLYMFMGMIGCYTFGTIWFMAVTGLDLVTSMGYCVIPFIPGDIVKIGLAAYLTGILRKELYKSERNSQ